MSGSRLTRLTSRSAASCPAREGRLGLLAWLLLAAASCASTLSTEPGTTPALPQPDASVEGGGADAPLEVRADEASADASGADAEAEAPPCLPDEDKDSIPDDVEGRDKGLDTDGDGTPDYLDLDSDGDTIPDAVEGDVKNAGCKTPQDSDGDGKPDFQDTDSDSNGLPDRDEIDPAGKPFDPQKGAADTDGDKYPDYADPDNDDDGLLDTSELVGGKAPDTDKDGLPDLDDVDSDGDTIADGQEGTGDFDKDGLANFRDTDSDADGVPDACEAGKGHKLVELPIDTDSDGRYDFLDLDTDADGLLDAKEDKNGNCLVDVADGETDRLLADSDNDGANDLVEVTLGSDPQDQFSKPETLGKFYFLLPYAKPAVPTSRVLPIDTGLQKADLGFVVDTTGTMGGEIDDLKAGIATILAALKAQVPDVAAGVGAHDDYPLDPYGIAGDRPFYLPSQKGRVTTTQADTVAALTALTLHNGQDGPESQIAGMWRALTNDWLQWPGTLVQPDSIPFDRFGSLAFRKNALPILVEITDAAFHNGKRAGAPASLHDPYSFNQQAPYKAPTVDTLVAAMGSTGARIIGIASDDGARTGDPYEDMAYLSDATGSLVPTSAFGGTTCNTALGGLPLGSPDGPNGTCRLVFDIKKNGVGLTERLVDGVKALIKSLTMDVRVVAIADEPDSSNGFVDSVDTFVEYVEVSLSGGDDPTDPAKPCVVLAPQKVLDAWMGPKGMSPGGDTYWDTVLAVLAQTKICYNVKVIDNTTIPQTDSVQVFHAVLQVRAKNGKSPIELDFGAARDVLFLVPAKPQ
jgi:hypothetical protein